MTSVVGTRAEVCAVACAELFRDTGEIMISPMANMASVGARLARLTFSPDILLTDGEALLLADTTAMGKTGTVEGWMPFGRVFETGIVDRVEEVLEGAAHVPEVGRGAKHIAVSSQYFVRLGLKRRSANDLDRLQAISVSPFDHLLQHVLKSGRRGVMND